VKASAISAIISGESVGIAVMGMTVNITELLLLAGNESPVAVVTEALFVTGPAVAGSVAVIVNVVVAPEARVAALQVTVVVPLQAPGGVAEMKVIPAGKVSVTTIPAAV
jgi:hypothetical protein